MMTAIVVLLSFQVFFTLVALGALSNIRTEIVKQSNDAKDILRNAAARAETQRRQW